MLIQDRVIFQPMSSFGDMFVRTGIVNALADKAEHFILPVYSGKAGLVETAKSLYSENSAIEIMEYSDLVANSDINKFIQTNKVILYEEFMPSLIKLNDDLYSDIFCDEQAYTFFDFPYSYKYTNFRFPITKVLSNSNLLYRQVVDNPRYIVIANGISTVDHEIQLDLSCSSFAKSNNVQIVKLNDVSNLLATNMLNYYTILANALEIHATPSAIFCLTDILNKHTKAKLFYHDIRRGTIIRVNNKWNNYRWNIVKYDRQL